MTNQTCIRLKADVTQIARCKEIISEHEQSLDKLANVISLAGNPVRMRILFLLHRERQLCVCDLSDVLSMNVSAISQHLRKLKDRDVILSERKAQTIFYSINQEFVTILQPFFQMLNKEALVQAI